MFSIIYPVITKITGKGLDINSLIDRETEMTYIESNNGLTLNTDKQVEETYILKIKENIKQGLEEKGYNSSKIDIEIETENEDKYGEIKKIYLAVEKIEDSENEEKSENSNKVDTIKKVEEVNINKTNIGNNSEPEKGTKNKTTLSKKQIGEIKKYLQDTYGVKKESIFINT